MDAEAVEDFFAPFAPVTCKRMFSGFGVYVGNACIAMVIQGDYWLKADAAMEAALADAGCRPFAYTRSDGKEISAKAFWSLPDAALDDPEELIRWCRPALAAAQRTAAEKADKLRRMRARHQNQLEDGTE